MVDCGRLEDIVPLKATDKQNCLDLDDVYIAAIVCGDRRNDINAIVRVRAYFRRQQLAGGGSYETIKGAQAGDQRWSIAPSLTKQFGAGARFVAHQAWESGWALLSGRTVGRLGRTKAVM